MTGEGEAPKLTGHFFGQNNHDVDLEDLLTGGDKVAAMARTNPFGAFYAVENMPGNRGPLYAAVAAGLEEYTLKVAEQYKEKGPEALNMIREVIAYCRNRSGYRGGAAREETQEK